MYGPFSDEEIDFYMKRLENESGNVINEFQKTLVFNLFYKYFGLTKTYPIIRTGRIRYKNSSPSTGTITQGLAGLLKQILTNSS